jgi:eukaryotic-like serine/threonine-protein kinase
VDCPDENTLLDFVQGRLAGEASGAVDRHLDSCADCQQLVGELGRTLSPVTPSLAPTAPGVPLGPGDRSGSDTLAPGTQVGRYVILERIGAGGMGVVYAARDPELDRKVALKLLRGGGEASEERATRLMREAQVMARLSHPNVIAVHDVGRYRDQLFVAMEHVDGMTLATWLRKGPRAWREVLDVFRVAGRGLAAAHHAGLVHRDFKPDNVLMDQTGRVRVTDFGLARASGKADPAPPVPAAGESLVSSPLTRTGALMGTPAYMAPEQFAGGETDARTDQFSFCVALYEALYGERPFAGESFEVLRAAVGAGSVQPARAVNGPRSLRRVLLRALSPSPNNRFPTMDALLETLDRAAAPRWRAWAVAGAATTVALLAAAVALQLRASPDCERAGHALDAIWNAPRRDAIHQAFLASQAASADLAWAETDRTLDQWAQSWGQMRAQACIATWVQHSQSGELLDLRMQCLDARRSDFSALADLLSHPDSTVVQNAPKAAHTLPTLAECANVQALTARVHLPAQPGLRAKTDELRAKLSPARALALAGKPSDAVKMLPPLVADARSLAYRPLLADVLVLYGDLQRQNGDFRASVSTLDEAVRVAEAAGHDVAKAQAEALLVQVNGFELSHFKEGEQLAQHAQATLERLGGDDVLEAQLLTSLGNVVYEQGRYSEAQKLHERALAIREKALGLSHPDVAYSLYALGKAVEARGDIAQSLKYLDRALDIETRALGPQHPDVAVILNAEGAFLDDAGRVNEALDRFQRSLAINERAFGPDHPYAAKILGNEAGIFEKLGRYDEALAAYRRAHEIQVRHLGTENNFTAGALVGIASTLTKLGRYPEAHQNIDSGLKTLRDVFGNAHVEVAAALCVLGQLCLAEHDYAGATGAYQEALDIINKTEPNNPDAMQPLLGLAKIQIAQGHPPAAVPLLERAVAIYQPGTEEPSTLPEVRFCLARVLESTGGDEKRAVALAKEALESRRAKGASRNDIDEMERWLAQAEKRSQPRK